VKKATPSSRGLSRASKKRGRHEAFANFNGVLHDPSSSSLLQQDHASAAEVGLKTYTTRSNGNIDVSSGISVISKGTAAAIPIANGANQRRAPPGIQRPSEALDTCIDTVALSSSISLTAGLATPGLRVNSEFIDIYSNDGEQHLIHGGCIDVPMPNLETLPDTKRNGDGANLMTANITIRFPLEENGDSPSEPDYCEPRYYCETVQWNLSLDGAPTPMMFATEVAREFGLSYAQTWDLADSIQSQLQNFVHDHFARAAPMVKKRDQLTPVIPHLYGEATGFSQRGGTSHPFTPMPKEPPCTKQHHSSTNPLQPAVATSKAGAKRRDSAESQRVENVYYNQVNERLRMLFIRDVQGKLGALNAFRENHLCHLCGDRKAMCGAFACGLTGHAFCMLHLTEKLGLVSPADFLRIEHCPVCTLSCSCSRCAHKLDTSASDFKRKCLEQGAAPEKAAFDNLLSHCRSLGGPGDVKHATAGAQPIKQRVTTGERTLIVQKIPPSDFPREVVQGADLSAMFEAEYQTVYMNCGSRPLNTRGACLSSGDENYRTVGSSQDQAPLEDGSVDFCNACKKVGNLLCCDFCPRAFHSECLPCQTPLVDSGKQVEWECPSCCCEREGLDADKVDGSACVGKFCDMYQNGSTDKQHATLLSILHDMLNRLIEYDFGYMFECPVDCEECPTYSTIVKKPMDLGTINSNLVKGPNENGLYEKLSSEDTALAVLKDVELVWHNCFMFNLEGSAVYRMAEVQRRSALRIRERSFDHLLSERMKYELSTYVDSLSAERDRYRQLESPLSERKVCSPSVPQTRLKIAGPGRINTKGRHVAVLDSESGRIVKIYSSLQASSNAVSHILSLKSHDCKWDASSIGTVGRMRRLIVRSQENPIVRLFGYRWVFLDDLKAGKVVLSSSDNSNGGSDEDPLIGAVEMVDGGISYFFSSVGEALSFPGLPCNVPDLFHRLKSLSPGAGLEQIAGRMWRRYCSHRPNESALDGDENADVSEIPGVQFVKEDVVLGSSQLIGFPHIKAAFQDWCQSVDASVTPFTGPKSLETFEGLYLNADRTVDGMTWRRVSAPPANNSEVAAQDQLLGSIPKCTEPSNGEQVRESSEPMRVASEPAKVDQCFEDRKEPIQHVRINGVNKLETIPTGDVPSTKNKSTEILIGAGSAALLGSYHETASATSQSTENSRESKVFDLETVLSPMQSFQKPKMNNVEVLNGLSENCHLALHAAKREDGIEVVGRRDASSLG
jgi:Bromodomain